MSFLERFCGYLSPKIDEVSLKLTFEYPHEGPCVATPGLGREAAAIYLRERRFQGSGFRVQGSGFRVQGSGYSVQGSIFSVEC